MRLMGAILCTAVAACLCADGYLWISCEHAAPYSIYRYNLRTRTIDRIVTLSLVEARVYNNLTYDGTHLYAGTNSTDLFAKLNPYTGRVRQVSSYNPPQPYLAYEDGAYNPATDTLWRAGMDLIETDRQGNVLHIYPYTGQLYGLAWVNGTLWATDFTRLGYLTLDTGSVVFNPVTVAGLPGIKVALAYDPTERLLYMTSLDWPTQMMTLHAINLDTMTSWQATNLSYLGYPVGWNNADAMDWVPPEPHDWAARYDGPLSNWDRPSDLAVDSKGNSYITGYVTVGTGDWDMVTVKYGPVGNLLWQTTYTGAGSDAGSAVALMPDGGAVSVGRSVGNGTDWDVVTIRYSPTGQELWVRRYDGPTSEVDFGTAVTTDADGNVYVAGHSMGDDSGPDYVVLKYDVFGNLLWERRYTNGARDVPIAIALDPDGNVLVAGWSGSVNGLDYLVVKYSNEGDPLWQARYDGPGHWDDVLRAMVIDGAGNVYITGRSWGDGVSWDFGTVKYSPNGDELWVRRVNANGANPDEANDLALTPDGVVVTGWSTTTNPDIWTVSYSATGDLLWERSWKGPVDGYDRGEAVAADADGNVYVTGRCQGVLGAQDWDAVTLKYNRMGTLIWARLYNGPGDADDGAEKIALGPSGHAFVCGSSQGDGTSFDWLLLRYSDKPYVGIGKFPPPAAN